MTLMEVLSPFNEHGLCDQECGGGFQIHLDYLMSNCPQSLLLGLSFNNGCWSMFWWWNYCCGASAKDPSDLFIFHSRRELSATIVLFFLMWMVPLLISSTNREYGWLGASAVLRSVGDSSGPWCSASNAEQRMILNSQKGLSCLQNGIYFVVIEGLLIVLLLSVQHT